MSRAITQHEAGEATCFTAALRPSEDLVTVKYDGSQTASISVTSIPEDTDSDPKNNTRDEITQVRYGDTFGFLGDETVRQVETLCHRRPVVDGVSPREMQIRTKSAHVQYDGGFNAVSRETTVEVQSAFDAPLTTSAGPRRTRATKVQRGYGYSFDRVSAEIAGHVKESYNCHPLLGVRTLNKVQRERGVSKMKHSDRLDKLDREVRLGIEETYDKQFCNVLEGTDD